MPKNEVTIVQTCERCNQEVGTFSVKKDNMMLSSKEQVWCPICKAYTPEVRDITGRLASIQREVQSYPQSQPAQFRPKK